MLAMISMSRESLLVVLDCPHHAAAPFRMSVRRWRRILLRLSLHAPLLAAGVRVLSCGRAVRRISTTIVGGEPRQMTVATAFAVVSEGCWWVVEWRRDSHAICRRRRPKPMLLLLLLLLLWCRLCATSIPLLQQASTGCCWMVLCYTDQGNFIVDCTYLA